MKMRQPRKCYPAVGIHECGRRLTNKREILAPPIKPLRGFMFRRARGATSHIDLVLWQNLEVDMGKSY
ncbi:hypothetical protein I7I48_02031 [Histoplasma ohiense]|nr:hypothetical protein I7I48_02031 [Histoplasma ohiense (nom. inval.)]